MEISPIRNTRDHENALRRIETLWEVQEGTPQADELEVLVTLVEAYEREHYPIDFPAPVDAIKFRLEQTGKDYSALIGIIGQRTRVYEVMRGGRPLSLNMIRRLHSELGIPAAVLIQAAPKRLPKSASRRAVSRTPHRRKTNRKSA